MNNLVEGLGMKIMDHHCYKYVYDFLTASSVLKFHHHKVMKAEPCHLIPWIKAGSKPRDFNCVYCRRYI